MHRPPATDVFLAHLISGNPPWRDWSVGAHWDWNVMKITSQTALLFHLAANFGRLLRESRNLSWSVATLRATSRFLHVFPLAKEIGRWCNKFSGKIRPARAHKQLCPKS